MAKFTTATKQEMDHYRICHAASSSSSGTAALTAAPQLNKENLRLLNKDFRIATRDEIPNG